jgi:hypothetical protein
LHADFDGFGGDFLQLGVERGVDAQAVVLDFVVARALDDLLVDEIDEVGGFRGVDVRRCEADGLGFGALGFFGGDGVGDDIWSSTRLRRAMARSRCL